jgi:predicted nucleic acid-binding protein
LSGSVVVDAGIVLATVLTEPLRPQARALLGNFAAQDIQIVVPTLFWYEIVAVLRKNVYRSTLQASDAEQYRDILLKQPVQTVIDEALLRRAFVLATQFNRPTAYDAQYLAVAERFGCDFWTADEKLFNVVHQALAWVKWLGNPTP